MFECSICFKTITNSCIGSCNHHFCYNCLLKWITMKQMKDNVIASCPKCRTMINEIRFDPEFDTLISEFNNNFNSILYNNKNIVDVVSDINSLTSDTDEEIERVLYINFKIESNHLGIVLQNNKKGPGVIISTVKCESVGKKHGLKKNDILLFVNNMPCFTSENTTYLINTLIKTKSTIKINIIPFIKKHNPKLLNNSCVFRIFHKARISATI